MITQQLVRQRVHTLPSLPTTVVELGEAVADERSTTDRLLGILAKDPPLSASLLRVANSVNFSGDKQVSDLRSAVMRLGSDALLGLARSAGVIRTFRTGTHLDMVKIWQHSVAVGMTAKGICGQVGKRGMEDKAFLAGLLHDIGKIALDTCFTEAYAEVVEAFRTGPESMVEAEARILGITHADVGAVVAESWQFPDTLVEVLRQHHTPPPDNWLANLIHLCDLLVRSRIPLGPYDEALVVCLTDLPSFHVLFNPSQEEDLDVERLTFEIDDELDRAVAFVQTIFKD